MYSASHPSSLVITSLCCCRSPFSFRRFARAFYFQASQGSQEEEILIVRHGLRRRILITGWLSSRARRNLITSCEDRIALTKSSKGGVKARARAQKGNRTRQSPSEWTTRAGEEEKKTKLNFPWMIKKNNVGWEIENWEESSFGSLEQFIFRDSFALI